MTFETQNFPALIRALLGDPIKGASSNTDWRYGKNSYLSVNPMRGVWHDNKAGTGGGLFDLVVHLGHSKDRAEAAKWLKSGGLIATDNARVFGGETLHDKAKRLEAEAKELAAKRERAGEIWAASLPLHDTPGLTYLTEARCIPESALEGITSLRFHPKAPLHPYSKSGTTFPALVAQCQDSQGGFVGVHLTYLASNGAGKADLPTPRKWCGGGFNGACVRLGSSLNLIAAEGIESALSAGVALGLTPIAALSATGLKAFTPWAGIQSVAFAPDTDASGLGMQSARSAAERLHRDGVTIAGFAIPPGGLCDWNDAARAGFLVKEMLS